MTFSYKSNIKFLLRLVYWSFLTTLRIIKRFSQCTWDYRMSALQQNDKTFSAAVVVNFPADVIFMSSPQYKKHTFTHTPALTLPFTHAHAHIHPATKTQRQADRYKKVSAWYLLIHSRKQNFYISISITIIDIMSPMLYNIRVQNTMLDGVSQKSQNKSISNGQVEFN